MRTSPMASCPCLGGPAQAGISYRAPIKFLAGAVVGITCAILVILFFIQSYGTAKIRSMIKSC
jgi:K+ transporter